MTITKRIRNAIESATYYMHFRQGGIQVYRDTGHANLEDARRYATAFRKKMRGEQSNQLLAGTRKRAGNFVGRLIEGYITAQCPDRKLRARVNGSLAEMTRLLTRAKTWWADKSPEMITPADCDDYRLHRRDLVAAEVGPRARQGGDRAIEMELQALSNVFTWAARRREVDANPLLQRPRYVDRATIRHARDVMPASGDELHRIAAALFEDPRSEVFAWAYLLECYTGMRTAEIRLLRSDATRDGVTWQPGCTDDKYLYIARAKKGTNPRIRLDDPERPEIRPLLERIRQWRASKWPESQYLLPGRGGEQMPESSLSHRLGDIVQQLQLTGRDGQPANRTSHGARAYYASVRLAQGNSPDDVARELGQRSGDALIRDVYGVEPDHFSAEQWTSLAATFTWLPSTPAIKPAWGVWAETRNPAQNIIPLSA